MRFYVKGDSFRLSQVLNNLISNAIKFTRVGEVKLRVEMTENNITSFVTRFSVIDSGIGIAKDKQEKIFEQFTQADSDTTRLYGGTGLGLSILGRLVGVVGGNILVDSVPWPGSTFRFRIWLQNGAMPASAVRHSDVGSGRNESIQYQV